MASTLLLPRRSAPSYRSGYAHSSNDSANPGLHRSLVGAWCPSMGITSTRLLDLSPYKNHGVLTAMEPALDWVTSEKGHALSLDGVAEYVIMPSISQYALDDFSMVIWVKRNGWAGAASRLFEITSVVIGASLQRTGGTDGLTLTVNGTSGTTTVALPDLTWTCVIATRRDAVCSIYYDGINVTTDSSCGAGTLTAGGIVIGARVPAVPAGFFIGLVGPTFLLNRVITRSEIQLLFRDSLAPLRQRPGWIGNTTAAIPPPPIGEAVHGYYGVYH